MQRFVNFKVLSVLQFAVVVCLLISNFYLYRKSYYGHQSLVHSRSLVASSKSDQEVLDHFDIMKKEQNTAHLDFDINRMLIAHKSQQFTGYLLTLEVYEQQTMATGNLLQLQCFASKMNLSVVQPFMKDSFLVTPLDEAKQRHLLPLEDVYNMTEWSNYAGGEGYTPLVKWEEFIKHASRYVILVQMKYPTLQQVKEIRKSGRVFPHPLTEERDYKEGCNFNKLENAVSELRSKQFHIIHKVCYNFMSGNEIPLHIYKDDILQGHSSNMVTVIVDEWRGLKEEQRVLIREDICAESAFHRDSIHSSSKVVRDAQLYADQYLHQNSDTNYLAVIARYEMTAYSKTAQEMGDPNPAIPFCIKETLRQMHSMKRNTKLKEVFLSVDIGKFGSESFEKKNYYSHKHEIESFARRIYRKINIKNWERSFESIVEKADTGYIAKVQQAIVARAKCVLFVGGGSFQQHTLHLYQELHPDPKEWCIKVVNKCTSKYRPLHIHM